MNRVHVGVATLNQTPLDFDGNRARIAAAIAEARARGVTLLCLPELCITGYGCEDMFHARWVHARAMRVLHELAEETRGLITCLGLPVEHRGGVYDGVAVVVDGAVRGFVAKKHLAGDGIHYEPRWFRPWPEGVRTALRHGDGELPIGDLRFDVGGLRVGFEVCEDAWVAARPGVELAEAAVDVIVNPSASHFAFGKQEVRRRLVEEGSRAFFVTYLYANLLGNEAGRVIYDGGAMIADDGAIVAESRRLGYAPFELVTAVIDPERARTRRGRTTSYEPSVEDDPLFVHVPFGFPELAPRPPGSVAVGERAAPRPPVARAFPERKEEELARALALALFDYLRKSRAQGYVVSLSGGADSAACACLVHLMVRFAEAELGLEGLKRALAHVRGVEAAADARAVVRRLLTTAYQSTRNSGPVTREAARAVAEAVGAEHHELDVDALVAAYTALAEQALGRPLTWEGDDKTLQNVQARARGPSVWTLANAKGALLVATSNRSEAAVGYATMDGDTAGGISPIAGVDKAFLRTFLRWLEREGPAGVGPLPALAAVNAQAPTAELRPPAEAQTDEGDLMPYPILDAIERLSIGDKLGPAETLDYLAALFPEVPRATMRAHLERFYRLFAQNQWKRERYAPSFHVDDENLDPKTWCRFPILSGGFAGALDPDDS
jgi:NAD+ synthase (glutamine-hydrolysing)